VLVKLADYALVARARPLRRRIRITRIAGRRRRCADDTASRRKTAVLVNSLGCCAMKNKGEQEKGQNARQRLVLAAQF
jgi:hypothetical protein